MSPTRRLAMSAALCLLAAGCASPWKKRVVHARSGAFVYVEHEERDGAVQPQGFDHPIALTAGEVAEIFRRLLHESRR
ncbi:MAG: hypothetical protein JXA90_08675, partial [Planctomycetes bacterium]|nr:hypothetical protein [Planctomycetota bacterium]